MKGRGKKTGAQKAALVGAVVCGFFALIPALVYAVFHTGVLALVGFTMLLFAFWLSPTGWPNWLRRGLAVIILLVLAGSAVLTLPMLWRAYFCPPAEIGPQVVLVLGSKIRENRPTLILAKRLQKAAQWLEQNPQAVCVATGGLGEDELYPEAVVMRSYLMELGIDPQRIYTEEASRNTRENMLFSAQVMEQNNLEGQVVIVTDPFHQLRAALYARQAGFESVSLPSQTPWGMAPCYWVREFFALGKLALEIIL